MAAGSASPTPAAPTTGWTAKIGTSGSNGSVALAVSGTSGSIKLSLTKLSKSTSLPVTLYRGTCAAVGTKVLALAAVRTSSSGAASRTNVLTASAVRAINSATNGAGKMVVRIGSGGPAKCGAFAKRSLRGPQAVVQSFYDWYLRQPGHNAQARPEVGAAFWTSIPSGCCEYDVFVCARDMEESAIAKAGTATLADSQATVVAALYLGGPSDPDPAWIPVTLKLNPAGWQIVKVKCGFG